MFDVCLISPYIYILFSLLPGRLKYNFSERVDALTRLLNQYVHEICFVRLAINTLDQDYLAICAALAEL